MTQERRMYELEYPAPQVSGEANNGPALIVAMHGYADAGHAIESAADPLRLRWSRAQWRPLATTS